MQKTRTKTVKTTTKKTLNVKKSHKTSVKRAQQNRKPTSTKGIQAPMFDFAGKSQGMLTLPKEVFGVKPNKQLMAQAARVYFANQFTHTASTKTRSEVRGGGAKPWRQKGTGRARAGSKRSPLWVGGGITFGPQPRKVRLNFPQKMKHKALICALSHKRQNNEITIISNFDKMDPKTKIAANLFKKLEISGRTLLIIEATKPNVRLAVRNIPRTNVEIVQNLNAYHVLENKNLLLSKAAIEFLKP